jgi:hypothetical protein
MFFCFDAFGGTELVFNSLVIACAAATANNSKNFTIKPSGHDLLDHFTRYIGQAERPSLELVGKFFVVES